MIIAAAILSVLAGRACTERRSVAPPPAPSPPRVGALDGGLAHALKRGARGRLCLVFEASALSSRDCGKTKFSYSSPKSFA